VLGLLAGSPIAAQGQSSVPPDNAHRADVLFREARKLMGERRFAEACPKLAESQRLDPGAGTLLNLGICHAGEGKTATAWAELTQALETARKDGREDRQAIASDALAKLDPRLSRLRVLVSPSAKLPGLEIHIDGTLLGPSEWGAPRPIDPGVHRIEASAPERRGFIEAVEIGAEGDAKSIEIPILAELVPTGKPPPGPEPGNPGELQRTAAYVVGGAGVVAIGVGSAFGIRAIVKDREADRLCPEPICADPNGLDASSAANTSATIANIGIGAGIAAIGVGVVLLLTAGSSKKKPGAALVTPLVVPAGSGVAWTAAW
jgi:hypothetical protein